MQLGEPARAGQKFLELAARQWSQHDFKLMLALPGRCAERRTHSEPLFTEPAVQACRNVEPLTRERPHFDGDTKVVAENGFEPIGRASLQAKAACAAELREVGHLDAVVRALG